MKRLKRAFGRLRALAVWKAIAGRGVYTFECGRNAETRQWHVHLHVVVNAAYIPHDWLSATWLRITGDSSIVYVKRATPQHAAYLAKYIAKPCGNHVQPDEEWAVADELKGLRVCETFGGEEPIRVHPTDESTEGRLYLGRLSDIRRQAEQGFTLPGLWLDELERTGQLDRLRLVTLDSEW